MIRYPTTVIISDGTNTLRLPNLSISQPASGPSSPSFRARYRKHQVRLRLGYAQLLADRQHQHAKSAKENPAGEEAHHRCDSDHPPAVVDAPAGRCASGRRRSDAFLCPGHLLDRRLAANSPGQAPDKGPGRVRIQRGPVYPLAHMRATRERDTRVPSLSSRGAQPLMVSLPNHVRSRCRSDDRCPNEIATLRSQ